MSLNRRTGRAAVCGGCAGPSSSAPPDTKTPLHGRRGLRRNGWTENAASEPGASRGELPRGAETENDLRGIPAGGRAAHGLAESRGRGVWRYLTLHMKKAKQAATQHRRALEHHGGLPDRNAAPPEKFLWDALAGRRVRAKIVGISGSAQQRSASFKRLRRTVVLAWASRRSLALTFRQAGLPERRAHGRPSGF